MSSPLILSLSTVFALIGIVLVAIAFGTNNWVEYHVNRGNLQANIRLNATLRNQLLRINSSSVYYDRTAGLFRLCFPNYVPTIADTYVSPLGATCINRADDYQIPEKPEIVSGYTQHQKTRMHLLRTCVGFYMVGLFFLFLCLFTGITGCWRRSAGLILGTGILLLFATLFLAAAMAVWHGVQYLEKEVISTNTPSASFFRTWHPILKLSTEMSYGWSYIIAWIGIGFVLISSVLMLAAYRSMKEEERDEYEKKRAPYMNYYDGKGGAMMPYAYPYAYPQAAAPYYASYASYNGAAAPQPQQQQPGYYGYLTYGR